MCYYGREMAEFTETITRKVNCPYCAGAKVSKWGKNANGKQTYRCKGCGKRFLHTGQVAGRHATAEQIGMAIRMYYGGNSYKQTAETMADGHDISEPSKETLYRWVSEYTDVAKDLLADHPAHTSGKWVADEIQVRVGGEKLWLWNIMDAGTRYALAVHLSPNRDRRAAVAVMRKAMAAADTPPKSITTDKLGSYVGAIKTVFPDAEHIQSEGLRARVNNNLSERLQGTIRDREKTLRGLEGLESGQAYFDGWAVNYNLFREHEGVDGQTPAEMAGVNPPFREWADVVRVAATDTGRKAVKPNMAEVADRAERGNPRIVPDSTQRRRPAGESDSDDEEEWPRSDSDTVQIERVRQQLKDAIRDVNLPPKKAAVILNSIDVPGPKRRKTLLTDKAIVAPPKSRGARKGDDDKPPPRAPVLVLGRPDKPKSKASRNRGRASAGRMASAGTKKATRR